MNGIEIARHCIELAKEYGADKVSVTLDRSIMDLVGTLDGEIDKVTRCMDTSLSLRIFAASRYGSYSTNDLREEQLRKFIRKAVETTRILQEDPLRDLPAKERLCTDAEGGDELELADPHFHEAKAADLTKTALEASLHSMKGMETDALISEEGEYSEELDETIMANSDGLCAIHRETAFEYGVEVTVQDGNGDRYSAFWWDSSPFRDRLDWKSVGPEAYRKAIAQINPVEKKGFRGRMVVDSSCSSKLLKPILSALNGFGIQQHDSFLEGKLGEKAFSEGLTVTDTPREKGHSGSRLFDSEGVATRNRIVIDKGVIKEYFLSTYMSRKLGMEPTAEEATAPVLLPWPKPGLTQKDILDICGSGILVTGFNGGNYDHTSGDFSYGIEGFAFENGEITHPIHEMLITGNFIKLWNNLLAAGQDARACLSKRIPTLAFENVDFNG